MIYKSHLTVFLVIASVLTAALFPGIGLTQQEPDMSAYVSVPIYLTSAVTPNILIILDNSGSMNYRAYANQNYDHSIKYYGYFEPYKNYSYDGNDFHRDPVTGDWDGNFLNWATMRRIDVVRKVIMGGKATSRQGGGNQTNIGEESSSSRNIIYTNNPGLANPPSYTYDNTFSIDAAMAAQVTPFNDRLYFGLSTGGFYVDNDLTHSFNPARNWDDHYRIRVKKDINYPDEIPNFVDGNIAGVYQKVGNRARWGLEFFNYGTGNNGDGGTITINIGKPGENLVTAIQNKNAETWTPLAESYYVALQYFRQKEINDLEVDGAQIGAFSHNFPNNAFDVNPNTADPYRFPGAECTKSFVILLTDGQSTKDRNIPQELADYDGDDNDDFDPPYGYVGDFGQDYGLTDKITYGSDGSNYLDDIALFARTNDLREDLDGEQNLVLYTIYAFGDQTHETSLQARRDLMDAAKNGGFIDQNGNNRPDLVTEWDKDGDTVPDNFFNASDGYELEGQLLQAITDILKRASSGTAVSVLATSAEGEGTVSQAYFKPTLTSGTRDINWVGYLQTLWVDNHGRLREESVTTGDTPGLVLNQDQIVEFFFDEVTNQGSFYRYTVNDLGDKLVIGDSNLDGIKDEGETWDGDTNNNGLPDDEETWGYVRTSHPMDELKPLWEAGSLLHTRSAEDRVIKTFLDLDYDGQVDSGEYVTFDNDPANLSRIKPFLGVKDSKWDYLGDTAGRRANNLIQFIRGHTVFQGEPDVRFRTLNSHIWKLGDIVHSTPVTLGKPLDNYHIIYSDPTYQQFYSAYKNRESVVYVGGNDGMLHAFYLGEYQAGDNPATGATEEIWFNRPGGTSNEYGEELWAYIPQALLPHLKWLADPDYNHVFYVDLKPKIVDARIFSPDAAHPQGWGTVLIGGLRMGGKFIWATDDFPEGVDSYRTFGPCYFALDITDPRRPELLWEKSGARIADCPPDDPDCYYENLAMTMSYPTVARVGDPDDPEDYSWYVIFGSGPEDYDGSSNQPGTIYIADLKTGRLLRSYQTSENQAFMNGAITVDTELDYSIDYGYIGQTHQQGDEWRGKIYRFIVPADASDADADGNMDEQDQDPAHWSFSAFFDSDGPVTAPGAAAVDMDGNLWLYFGTGRYFNDLDKADDSTQYFFGIKEPYENHRLYETDAEAAAKSSSDYNLMNSTDCQVFTDGTVMSPSGQFLTWKDLVTLMKSKDGWVYELGQEIEDAGERILEKPSVFGGIAFSSTFIPNADPCGFGGDSNLLGLFYTTGTSYTKALFTGQDVEGTTEGIQTTQGSKTRVENKISIGQGQSSSMSIHSGMQEGATGFVQQSTGIVKELALDPPFKVRSGFIFWRAK